MFIYGFLNYLQMVLINCCRLLVHIHLPTKHYSNRYVYFDCFLLCM